MDKRTRRLSVELDIEEHNRFERWCINQNPRMQKSIATRLLISKLLANVTEAPFIGQQDPTHQMDLAANDLNKFMPTIQNQRRIAPDSYK